jgi:hypothetical protein
MNWPRSSWYTGRVAPSVKSRWPLVIMATFPSYLPDVPAADPSPWQCPGASS